MKHVHLIGIGGTGLSAIALVLLESGIKVSGSDRASSPLFERLRRAGAQLFIGHRPENIQGADIVIRSSAIPDDNPEVLAAHAMGTPVLKRADYLAQLTVGKQTIAVAGTHGKTTTTAMIAWVLTALGLDPSYIIGSVAKNLATNAHAGQGPFFVIEADEYDRMFLGLNPSIAIVTNIEHDHPDCYPTPEDFYQAFRAFASRLSNSGYLLVCADDSGAARLGEEEATSRKVITYGITSPGRDYSAQELRINSTGGYDFKVLRKEILQPQTDVNARSIALDVSLQAPGLHNVSNALATFATADIIGLPLQKVSTALAEFRGADRRFEVQGEVSGITVVDDYAHHPTEIRATLSAARARFARRTIWVVWQPHTYSRTRALIDDFAAAFGDRSESPVEHVIVTEIFAAREAVPEDGFSSKNVVDRMNHPDAQYVPDLNQVCRFLLDHLQPGDVLLVLSAGNADQISREVLRGLSKRAKPLVDTRDSLKQDIPLARYTAARVGGPADVLWEVQTAEELADAARSLWDSKEPFLILGGGSNVLVSDKGVRGVVVINRAKQVHFDEQVNPPQVWAESGANFGALARLAAQKGLSGLEWAAGIPGTLGGAVVGNAGAHGKDVANNFLMAEILHQNGKVENWSKDKMQFAYRSSVLKHPLQSGITGLQRSEAPDRVVLSAVFVLERSTPEAVQEKIDTFVAHRRQTQPPGASMGSMFKNPPGDFAGRLIEAAGLKGARIGDAEISPLHANFFVNLGQATAADIRALIVFAQQKVFEQFDVKLELEIELVGEW